MPTILTTGGCGYIGSHTIVDLVSNGYQVISVDDLSRGHISQLQAVETITGVTVPNEQVDLSDREATRQLFKRLPQIDGIVHFAAYKWVGESVRQPQLYYRNNIDSLLHVLEFAGVKGNKPALVFSSSCSVYGNPATLPVTEDTPLGLAESPYSYTKQVGERILTDVAHADNWPVSLLRYFNPVGSHKSGLLGDYQEQPENLVPYITQTAIGRQAQLNVFGTDYDTRDGTCVRDYIHVMDIAHAHTLAINRLLKDQPTENPEVFNLGTGNGVTVLEVIHAFEEATGQKLNYKLSHRRPGDVVEVYANNDKARHLLGWQPQYSLHDMMHTAWLWEQHLQSKRQ